MRLGSTGVRHIVRLGIAALLLSDVSRPIAAQTTPMPPPDPFAPLAFLIGRWDGTSEGQPGNGTIHRDYEKVLNGRFIRARNHAEYPAQEKNPKGEIHEDEGYLSFDRGRKKLVLRQFHVEGFVNQYVEDEGTTPTRISFTTETIENIPPGWRARETYVVSGPDAFEEIFELAETGKPFAVYSRARLRRVK
jgi:THAP4-like, heme-binding beta-barrel domain